MRDPLIKRSSNCLQVVGAIVAVNLLILFHTPRRVLMHRTESIVSGAVYVQREKESYSSSKAKRTSETCRSRSRNQSLAASLPLTRLWPVPKHRPDVSDPLRRAACPTTIARPHQLPASRPHQPQHRHARRMVVDALHGVRVLVHGTTSRRKRKRLKSQPRQNATIVEKPRRRKRSEMRQRRWTPSVPSSSSIHRLARHSPRQQRQRAKHKHKRSKKASQHVARRTSNTKQR